MSKKKFYICPHCGNIVGVINDGGVVPTCCAKRMLELVPNTSDGAGEKHVPVISVEGNLVTVSVGSVAHPMVDEHYIGWIYLATKSGGQRKVLKPGDEPKAQFALVDGDEAIGAYAYCNLHGLWYADK